MKLNKLLEKENRLKYNLYWFNFYIENNNVLRIFRHYYYIIEELEQDVE